MKNSEKYKTAEERSEAFTKHCHDRVQHHGNLCSANGCPLYSKTDRNCSFRWLDLEAEDEQPLPCPYCERKVQIVGDKTHWSISCVCGYSSLYDTYKSDAIARHNELCRQLKGYI